MINLTRSREVLMYYPRGNHLMETMGSVNFDVFFDDSVSNNSIKPRSILIHEHDFVQVTGRVTHCITCDSYYCSLCGNLLESKVITLILALTE
jgi:hypothetical protein